MDSDLVTAVTLQEKHEALLRLGKSMMSSMAKEDVRALSGDCDDAADVADSFVQAYENKIEDMRRKQREIADTIGELKKDLGQWESLKKRLSKMGKRLNGRFWDIEKGRVEEKKSEPSVS